MFPSVRLHPSPVLAVAAAFAMAAFAAGAGTAQEPPDPVVTAVRFRGLSAMDERRAERIVGLRVGRRIGREAAAAAAGRLREAYRARHFYDPGIRWRVVATEAPGTAEVVFDVIEGPRGVVTEVAFDGCRALDERTLAAVVGVTPRPGLWARFAGLDVFLREELDADREALAGAYADRGFLEARVGEPRLVATGPDTVRIEWPIEREGPRFRLAAIEFAGRPAFDEPHLRAWAGLPAGGWMSSGAAAAAGARIAGAHRERGYPFAAVTAAWRAGGAPGDAIFAFDIQPGPRCAVRAVVLDGLAETRERVLRREIDVRPGAWYRESEVAAAHERLLALGLFESVEARAVAADAPGLCDVRFAVQERKSGSVAAGATFGTVEGPAALLTLRDANLALAPPFRGGGLLFEGVAQWGSKHRDLNLSLTNPRLFDSRFLLREAVFHRQLEYLSDDYDTIENGATIGLGRPFARRHMIVLAYTLQTMEIRNVSTNAAAAIREEEGERRIGSLSLQWTRDTRRPAFRPAAGGRVQAETMLGSDALGGNTDVYGASLSASLHLSPGFDHVVSLRGRVQGIDAYGGTETVPLALRHFLGGPGDLRGFEYRSIAPRDADGNAVGGRSAWHGSAEYAVPLASWLDASLYYDIGQASAGAFDIDPGAYVADWGIGIAIRAENFPVRFDLAVPTRTDEGTEDQRGRARLSFSAGYTF